jgi:uncharacterized OB-fold protein
VTRMQVKLIAYSVIEVAPPGYQTPYGVAMAEDEKGARYLVRIKQDGLNVLKIGLSGELRREKVDGEELEFFYAKQ